MSVDKKMISPNNEWYIGNVLVCAHFSSKLAHGTYCLCSFTHLFRLLGVVYIFSHVNAQKVLWCEITLLKLMQMQPCGARH